jgi:SAM-dependent methyltransferase
MDLRPFIKANRYIIMAKDLIVRRLMGYQPFIFADDLETGYGWRFMAGESKGSVWWPKIDPEFQYALKLSEFKKHLIPPDQKDQFTWANQCLRRMYDNFIQEILKRVDDISCTTFADVGCNSGYFPTAFSMHGAKEAVGFDRADFTYSFELLNSILGTNARFINKGYDPRTQSIDGSKSYDVVISCAVLCHLSDPLQHLAFLGSIARKMLFIWTPVVPDEQSYCIIFGEPNKYYKDDRFPFCFDNQVKPSARLLRKSLELMGFEIYEVPNCDGGMPDRFYNLHKAFLGIRPNNGTERGKGLPSDVSHFRTPSKVRRKEDPKGGTKRVVLFGASSKAHQVCQDLKTKGYKVIFLVDNNPETWGNNINGVPIYPPTDLVLRRKDYEMCIVLSLSIDTIVGQLIAMKLRQGKDFLTLHQFIGTYAPLPPDPVA